MKKIITSTGKLVFVNLIGLRTANIVKSKSKEEWFIALNYGDSTNQLVGAFQSENLAEETLSSLV